jgi:hypothetical protein
MRTALKGVNRARMRLADGRVVTYYYAWKGGPRLRGQRGDPEFVASYTEAISQRTAPAPDVLASLLQRYERSSEFQKLRERTRRSYVPLLRRIERRFAKFPLSALSDPRTRGVFL